MHHFLFPTKHQSIYFNTNSPNNLSMKQESATLQELTALNKRCVKTGAKSIAVAKQEYSTNISEEYEYSHEKAERVSLSTEEC